MPPYTGFRCAVALHSEPYAAARGLIEWFKPRPLSAVREPAPHNPRIIARAVLWKRRRALPDMLDSIEHNARYGRNNFAFVCVIGGEGREYKLRTVGQLNVGNIMPRRTGPAGLRP